MPRPFPPPPAKKPKYEHAKRQERARRNRKKVPVGRAPYGTREQRELEAAVNTALAKAAQERPELIEATKKFSAALEGDGGALMDYSARGLAELEVVRQMVISELFRLGMTIEQVMMDRSGQVFKIIKDNPLLFHLPKLYEILGLTANDQLLSKKSRGETAKNLELAALLQERRIRLANSDPKRVPRRAPAGELPPAPVTIETVATSS